MKSNLFSKKINIGGTRDFHIAKWCWFTEYILQRDMEMEYPEITGILITGIITSV